MPAIIGRRLGPYEVESLVGAGGMGQVYQARDTRLNRTVAIKVLPESIAGDPARRERLRLEARTIAALSHPHICTLHDIGHDAGIDFLVMEHLTGETLAERLRQGALPVPLVLEYAAQVADAIDTAHRAGIVHRDLKPGNIMLTKAGAKVLDFGLAKLRPPAPIGAQTSSPATRTASLTIEGTIVGTVPYMAPEQLEGREADARTDIFALGAVIFEMAAGRRAFEASTDASLIGAILRDDPPPLSHLQPLVPVALERLVSACLAKDPNDRWQSAADLKRELRWIREGLAQPTSARAGTRRDRLRRQLIVATALGVAATAGGLAVGSMRRAPAAALPLARLTIPLPDSTVGTSLPLACMSPDGRRVAFLVGSTESDSLQRVFVRSLDGRDAELMPNTEGVLSLFWSPDSGYLGFTTDTAVKKLAIAERLVDTLCDSCAPARGGSWSRSGLIVFPSQDGRLMGVPAGGGALRPVTSVNRSAGELAHFAPHFLPDGRRLLYIVRHADPQRSRLVVGELGSSDVRPLLEGEHPASYAPPGYLLFARAGSIVAQPFDAERLTLSGNPVSLVASDEYWPTTVHGGNAVFLSLSGLWPSFSASDGGVLAYAVAEQPRSQFWWIERAGERVQPIFEAGPFMSFDLTADGTRLAFSRGEAVGASLWALDLATGLTSRQTFGSAASYFDPRWFADRRLLTNRPVPAPLATLEISPQGRESIVSGTVDPPCLMDDASQDGRYLLCRRDASELVALSLTGGEALVVVQKAPAGHIDQAQFSPDGRWVAYNANESGRFEVYVAPFPPSGERFRASRHGGVQPMWRPDGKELYFLDLEGVLHAVVWPQSGSTASVAPTRLFDTGLGAPSPWIEQYAPNQDGRRFLVLRPKGTTVRNSVGLVLNWPALLGNDRSP